MKNKKTRNLFTQAVLSNNEVAISKLYNKIKESGLEGYKNAAGKTIDQVILADLFMSSWELVNHTASLKENEYWIEISKAKITLPNSISADFIKERIIDNDLIGLHAAFDSIPREDKEAIALDVLYKLIDYRAEQGY